MSAESSPDLFAKWVRDALGDLYDIASLQRSPLVDAFDEEGANPVHRAQSLRKLLLETIRSMRPGSHVPAHSPDWRSYRILELRYIEGLSPDEVMKELCLSRSHYFREQARVLTLMTGALRQLCQERHALPDREKDNTENGMSAQSEIDRLLAGVSWCGVDAVQVLNEIRPILERVFSITEVDFDLMQPLTVEHASRVLLRQALLDVIVHLSEISGLRRVEIATFANERECGIHISADVEAQGAQLPGLEKWAENMTLARQLLNAMKGDIHLSASVPDRWEARLAWTRSVPHRLLVVDDHRGFVDLFRRYLIDADWQVVGASSGEEARRAIAETRPKLIMMDVLMPTEDGWELLMAFKTHQDTRDIPVIICSILDQAKLALSLGADAYLPKPIDRAALLSALEQWC